MKKILNYPLVSLLGLIVILLITGRLLYMSEKVSDILHLDIQSNGVQAVYGDTLHILSYSGYFSDFNFDEFEASNDVHVEIEPVESPSELQHRVGTNNHYDIIIVNDYLVEPMAEAGYLVPIAHNRMANFTYIDDRFRAIDYDYGNQYSVPFMWGTVGLSYNSNHVVGLPLSWEGLFQPSRIEYLRGRIALLDDYRVTMGILLLQLGLDPNTEDESEIAQITDELLHLVPYVVLADLTTIGQSMSSETLYMSMMWSGEAALLSSQNRNIRYTLPSEGTIFWVDNMTISSQSDNTSLAYQFIDYILTPRIIADISNSNYHANPVTNSRRYIKRNILNGPAYANPYVSGGVTMINHIGENDTLYQRYWEVFTDSLESWQSSVAEQDRRPR